MCVKSDNALCCYTIKQCLLLSYVVFAFFVIAQFSNYILLKMFSLSKNRMRCLHVYVCIVCNVFVELNEIH